MKLCLICSRQFDDTTDLCSNDSSKLIFLGQDEMANKRVDKYHVLELVGRGSVGRVYKAQSDDGQQVAIKVLHEYLQNDKETHARFRREAQALSQLRHPNLLSIIDFGELPDGQMYLVMELLSGRNLEHLLKAEGYLPLPRAMFLFQQVCAALSEAHRQGVVHRDIKPSNVFLTSHDKKMGANDNANVTGKGDVIKILDFGIAKLALGKDQPKLTQDGLIRGSPAYMSPEQCRSMEVDQRSDIYSLAVMIFETLTGRRPFAGKEALSLVRQQVMESPPRLASIRPELRLPAPLDKAIDRALSKNPEDRPQTVEQFWDELSSSVCI